MSNGNDSEYTVKRIRMENLVPDSNNANRGTVRGNAKLEDSIQKSGHGRSGLLDKNGRIIAGNKFHAKSGELGAEEAIVIQSDGTKPIFVQRTDLDLEKDERARLLAYYDNFVAQVDLAWDEEQIAADFEAGLPLDEIWSKEELDAFLGIEQDSYNPQEEEEKSSQVSFNLKVECRTEEQLRDLYDRLLDEGFDCNMQIG